MQSEIEKWNACRVGNQIEMHQLGAAITSNLSGPVLEFGVYTGHGTRSLAQNFPHSQIYGFDSWQGLPEDDPYGWESFTAGAYAAKKDFSLEVFHPNVKLIDGWFKDTLPIFVKEHPEPARFLSIDCDLYSSTKDIFDHVIVQPGTAIYFDEYKEFKGWENREFRAFMEFIERTGYDYKYVVRSAGGAYALVQLLGK